MADDDVKVPGDEKPHEPIEQTEPPLEDPELEEGA